MRADAPPGSAEVEATDEADCVLRARLADAVLVLTVFTGFAVAAAGVLAGAFASGVDAACCCGGGGGATGAGVAGAEAGGLLAIVTGLAGEPEYLKTPTPTAPTISATATAPTILGVLLGWTSSGCTVWKVSRPAPLPSGSVCREMGRSSDELKSRKDMQCSYGMDSFGKRT
jgi:hypothetical protein